MRGSLTMIVGPMFSAKSAILINKYNELAAKGQRIFCVKPVADTRDRSEIKSRKGAELPAKQYAYGPTFLELNVPRSFLTLNDSIDPSKPQANVIIYDEIHMFEAQIVPHITRYLEEGIDVVCAGLELDWRTRPFIVTSLLLASADNVLRTIATCDTCGAPAHFTQRLIDSDALILAGDRESYRAACHECYQSPPCLSFSHDQKVSINVAPISQ